MAAKMAMIATTIINSMRVKPVMRFVEGMVGILGGVCPLPSTIHTTHGVAKDMAVQT